MLHSVLRWTVSNAPAMNVLMGFIIVIGIFCGFQLRREMFPDFDMEYILVSVPYPGATPEEVENGICQKIEEALQSLNGVRKITSTANEGAGMVQIELRSDVKNIDRALNEVKDAVDRVTPQLPEMIEQPTVQRLEMQETIISLGVLGPQDDSAEAALALRQVAEDLREELLQYPKISMVNLVGTKDYQIDIEIPEDTLRSYHLTLNQAASRIRAENIQTPGGTIRAPSQEINVRTDNRRYDGQGIGELPFITTRSGTVIKLNEIAYIRDEFVDSSALATVYTPPPDGIPDDTNSIQGRHVIALDVLRNTNEDLLAMVDNVYDFVAKKNQSGTLPQGYSLTTWGDHSVEVRARLELLLKNGFQGLFIVFILLTLFLDLKLAFWTAAGIPFAICATSILFYGNSLTLNMLSMFGVITGLGIVVDDSIVAGENIYTHRNMGKNYFEAAVDGIAEVFPSIFASVMTTVMAFFPLMFITGIMGKLTYFIPVVVITMLLASLSECFGILPCHLAHRDNLFLKMLNGYLYIFSWLLIPLRWASGYTMNAMDFIVQKIYAPSLKKVLQNRGIFIAGCLCTLSISVAIVLSGTLPFVFFPKLDGNDIMVTLNFPNGTPAEVTDQWTQHLERSFWKVAKEYEKAGTPVATRSARVVGTSLNARGTNLAGASGGGNSYQGSVQVELTDGSQRTISSMEIADRWRKEAGPVPGADELKFETQMFGPPGGDIEFLLVAKSNESAMLEQAVEECKAYLAGLEGTQDITDSDMPGKYEFRLKIKEKAMAMGLHPEDLASVIRATYYGAEVQRLQRGRHEVKVMVCYPREDRRSLGDFNEIRIRTTTGEYPITELADIEVVRGYTAITRRNQQRSITVSADVDENRGNARKIVTLLNTEFFPKLKQKYPAINIIWGGDEEEFAESFGSMVIGFSAAMCAMFILLTIQFRSYLQPLIIMAIIPFGLVGSVAAHFVFGRPLSFISLFGLVALSGIIVNDSIVMIDFINRKIRNGVPVRETLINVGQNRFRPIVLTSVTTIGGLLPMVTETSFQAQMVIPMALSLAGGVAFALILVLYFVPVLYSYYTDLFVQNAVELENFQ